MSDAPARAGSRRNPIPFVVAAVVLAFLAGLALMSLTAQRWRWMTPTPRALPTASQMAPPRHVSTPGPGPIAPSPQTQTDPATLAARETMLGAQIAALEARLTGASADARVAGAQAGRAEAMLLAFAARRAVDRGLGLGGLEAPFRDRFASTAPRAAAVVIAAARQPVTLTDLRSGLDALGPALVAGGTGWWRGVRGMFGSLLVIHREGDPSPAPADRLARIRQLLDAGQVDGALAEVRQLPGANEATNWMAAARRWADAHRALDQIEAAALALPPAALPPTLPTARSAP